MTTKNNFSIFNFALSIILVLTLLSCSPQKKLHRLLKKHPELLQTDTIKINDSIFIPEIRIDTIFRYSTLKDTIVITKEKLKIKILEVNDTVFLDASVKSDTVVLNKEIPVEKMVYTEPKKWYFRLYELFRTWMIAMLVGILIGIFVLRK